MIRAYDLLVTANRVERECARQQYRHFRIHGMERERAHYLALHWLIVRTYR